MWRMMTRSRARVLDQRLNAGSETHAVLLAQETSGRTALLLEGPAEGFRDLVHFA